MPAEWMGLVQDEIRRRLPMTPDEWKGIVGRGIGLSAAAFALAGRGEASGIGPWE